MEKRHAVKKPGSASNFQHPLMWTDGIMIFGAEALGVEASQMTRLDNIFLKPMQSMLPLALLLGLMYLGWSLSRVESGLVGYRRTLVSLGGCRFE